MYFLIFINVTQKSYQCSSRWPKEVEYNCIHVSSKIKCDENGIQNSGFLGKWWNFNNLN